MSFLMTCDIEVEGFKPFKCHGASWVRKMNNYADSAKVYLPGRALLIKNGDINNSEILPTGMALGTGKKIQIKAGYNGNNKLRFKGFIKRINWTIPVEIECEGYSYQLQTKRVNKTYQNVQLKQILKELVKGTDIKLSPNIPDILVEYVQFNMCSGVQVLEWFRDKMLQTVYFNFDELYVGLRYLDGFKPNFYTAQAPEVQYRLNWNVIKDNDLVFDVDREMAIVNIQLDQPLKTGGYKRVLPPKPGNVKKLKLYGLPIQGKYAQQIRNDKQKENNNKGYTGRITAFLEPMADLNIVAVISDPKYEQRTGRYVIEGIEGTFSHAGGRQKLDIGINL